MNRVDVVVVGAGSAGAVVASRLSEDPARRVLLLEAGRDFPDEELRTPHFLSHGNLIGGNGAGTGPATSDLDWEFESEMLPGGRRVALPRGKLVGGSSMTNGCVWVRGRPSDFDVWVEAGAAGWGWDDVLPYYERVEHEVPSMRHPREQWLPITRTIVDGYLELGFRWVDDINAPDSWDGVAGLSPLNRRNEIRQGTLVTYIRAARKRPNFSIRDRVLVDRVLFEGNRAVGVAYVDEGGRPVDVQADHVVLSAGAYGSAPILLRSGVGPAAELAALGIPVVEDLPVGRDLLEHPALPLAFSTTPETARNGWPALAATTRGETWFCYPMPVDGVNGIGVVLYCLATVDRPEGSIRIASTAPDAKPVIDHRYADMFASGFDEVWRDWRRLLATDTLRAVDARDLDGDLPLAERLPRLSDSTAHPAGGCSIGRVVDPDLGVYGIEGLSVADASVFPRHVSNNPNMTCHVVGEIAAERILSRSGGIRTDDPSVEVPATAC